MKKLLLACSFTALAFASGAAADTAVDDPAGAGAHHGWTGFYAGLHAGAGFGSGDNDTSLLPDPLSFGAQPFSSVMNLDGFIGGAQFGYNRQFGRYVLGAEADFSWTDMDGSAWVSPLSDGDGVSRPEWFQDAGGELDWFGTARARAGVLVRPDAQLYATGGLAYGHVEYATFTSFTPEPQFQYSGGAGETKLGWTAGGGFEWALAADWSLKIEYLYFDLGETSYVALPLAPNEDFAVTQSFDTTGKILRLGANFRF